MTTVATIPKGLVYLASASPRRRDLLSQLGIDWRLLAVAIDETRRESEDPAAYVRRLALAKARAACGPEGAGNTIPVLAADTAVVIDAHVLGKPLNENDGRRMLQLLSGRTHEVLTAVAVVSRRGESIRLSRNEVRFRHLAPDEARAYWATGEPADKAGGYAIQGLGAIFVSELRGSYSGVVGLPLFETAELLSEHGVVLLAPPRDAS